MAEPMKLASEEARGGIFWSKGKKLVSSDPPPSLPDVRIIRSRTLTGVKCEKGWLSFRLEPIIKRINCGDGGVREVQTFRVHRPNGDEQLLMVCGTCGDLCYGDVVDVVEAANEGCRCCGAGLAPVACITPHTFGGCLYCPEPAELFMPVGGLANARVQSDPAQQQGPPQPSTGLAPRAAFAECDVLA